MVLGLELALVDSKVLNKHYLQDKTESGRHDHHQVRFA